MHLARTVFFTGNHLIDDLNELLLIIFLKTFSNSNNGDQNGNGRNA